MNTTFEYRGHKIELQHVNNTIWIASEGVRAIGVSVTSEEHAKSLAASTIDADEASDDKQFKDDVATEQYLNDPSEEHLEIEIFNEGGACL